MRLHGFTLCFLSFALVLSGLAQSAPGNSGEPEQAATNDPAELMRLAGALNRVVFPGVLPWHLKASYEILDSSGHKVDRGVYEFFWASPNKFKQSFASKSFTQTDYMTERGVLRFGDQRGISGPERVIAARTLPRMPSEGVIRNTTQQMYPQAIDGQTFRCVTLNSKPPVAASATVVLPSYCLDMERVALRHERGTGTVSSELLGETTFNEVLVFQGHFVARDIRVSHFDKPYLHIHVETLETIAQVDDAEFQPPSNAIAAGAPRPVVSDGEMQSRLIHRKEPGSVGVLNDTGTDERVILSLIVGKDGTVTSIRPIGGWKDLQTLMTKAVSQWVYRPYTVAGQPVEVESEVIQSFEMRKP